MAHSSDKEDLCLLLSIHKFGRSTIRKPTDGRTAAIVVHLDVYGCDDFVGYIVHAYMFIYIYIYIYMHFWSYNAQHL